MKHAVLLAGALTLAACGEEAPPTPVQPQQEEPNFVDPPEGAGDPIPDPGRLPSEVQVLVDELRIPPLRVEEGLRTEWARYLGSPQAGESVEEQLAGFFAQPGERCGALALDFEIEQEAARLFDTVDAKEVDALEARLRTGGRLLWFEQVAGPEAARAYVERLHRRALLEKLYTESSEEVPEEEVLKRYQEEVLAQIPDAADREGVDVSYEKLGPAIRARLQRERGMADLAAWAQAAVEKRELVVVLPDGTRLE